MEGTLASYVLLEGLLLPAGGAGSLRSRGENRRSPFPRLIGSTVVDSVASQSKYSPPTIPGFTMEVASVDTFRPGVNKG